MIVSAGSYAAALALAFRDLLHDAGGLRWVLATIGVGCVVSYVLGDPRIALASAVAFIVAELIDLAVYAPLRKRNKRLAIFASNAVGATADTLLFLAIAGFPVTASSVLGQLLVKAVWVTGAYLILAEGIRRFVSPRIAVLR